EPVAQKHLWRARDYAAHLWCRDAFAEYERAIELDPVIRSDPKTTSDGLRCLVESQHGRGPAIHFLADTVGPPAESKRRALASDWRAPEVRRAAEEALQRIH